MKQDIILCTDGTREEVTPANGEYYTLQELQSFVKGYIEIINLKYDPDHVLVVNEEGRLWEEPFNKNATFVATFNDFLFEIVGDAFYCRKDRIK